MGAEVVRLAGVSLDAPRACALPRGEVLAFTRRATDKGDDEPNEDSALVVALDDGAAVLAVADGVGGHALGDQASAAALDALADALRAAEQASRPARDGILDGFEQANAAVRALPADAATTLLVVELADGGARVYHAGDSQALVCGQRGRVKHWSTPHSPVGYAVEAGLIGEREALVHEDRHLVSNALGSSEMRIDVGPVVKLAPRDTVLLASDGLADNLTLQQIVDGVRRGPLLAAVTALIERTTRRMTGASSTPGKPDDLTLLAWRAAR